MFALITDGEIVGYVDSKEDGVEEIRKRYEKEVMRVVVRAEIFLQVKMLGNAKTAYWMLRECVEGKVYGSIPTNKQLTDTFKLFK